MPQDRCRCAACYGLADWLVDHGLDTRGLPVNDAHFAPPPVIVADPCDGSMTCGCSACLKARQQRAKIRPAPQPWDVQRRDRKAA